LHWSNPNLISRKPIRTAAHQELSNLSPALDPRCCRTKTLSQFGNSTPPRPTQPHHPNFAFVKKERKKKLRLPEGPSPAAGPVLVLVLPDSPSPSSTLPVPGPPASPAPAPSPSAGSLNCAGVLSVLPIRSSAPRSPLFNTERRSYLTQIPTTLPPHRASAAAAAMVYVDSWDEFVERSVQLFRADPSAVRRRDPDLLP